MGNLGKTMDAITFETADGTTLGGTLFAAAPDAPVLIVAGATAVPHQFYRRFATHMQRLGWTVLTFDYRGIGASAPDRLRGYKAHLADWGQQDIQAAVDYAQTVLSASNVCMIGHSAGGQQAGLITGANRIAAMMTVSAQSGYWKLQGGLEKLKVLFFVTALIPGLTRVFGYFPWRFFGGENLPYHIALEWSRWCRSKGYLLDDPTLPLERYQDFTAPIRAYSVDDDNWGTKEAVHAMMRVYPNVDFQHLVPKDKGLKRLGHMGFFRKGSELLWDEAHDWFTRQT